MKVGAAGAAGLSLVGSGTNLRAGGPPEKPKAAPPGGDDRPLLRLEAGGPTSFVTSLAFSPDGKTLYAAGFDKVVRVWKLQGKEFVLDKAAYRVPIGPGISGSINAMAVSPDADGTWLAAGGKAIMRGEQGFRDTGMVVPQIGGKTPEMRADEGTIFLFNTQTQKLRRLRGHRGGILSMAFAPYRQGKPPILVSTALEWDSQKYAGVIRVWNVETGREITSANSKSARDTRPGLAVQHSGNAPDQLRISFAWNDGNLYLWDVEKGQLWTEKDGPLNIALANQPEQGKVLSGSVAQNSGNLQLWDVRPGRNLERDGKQISITREDGNILYPRALTLVSLKPGGKLDHAAAVLRVPTNGEEYILRLFDLENPAAVKASKLLWKGGSNIPTIAFAPKTAYLAVAGNDEHVIRIFPVAELLKGETEGMTLRSAGDNFQGIAFLRKNQDLALLLRRTSPGQSRQPIGEARDDDLVFDITKRSLLADQAGWKVEAPPAGDWQARVVVAEKNAKGEPVRWAVSLRKEGQEKTRIELEKSQPVTGLAILPPVPGSLIKVPILALAFVDELIQPWLYLYNAETGEQIRQYVGHTDRIQSLAFSADGRLLATAADDQTVCVWSLIGLPQVFGQRGRLPGVAVKDDDGKLVIAKVDANSPAAKQLANGDVVEGVVEGQRARKLRTPREFYESVSQLKPGSTLTIQVAGKGPVRLPVGQYIDQQNALLSLFITRPDQAKPRDREWVGWSPDGQFDASDRKTERLIGWHFNKGKDADSPPIFAYAEQYRKEYYKEGILKHLVATGRLSDALKSWEKEDKGKPLPKPKMVFWIDEQGSEIVGPDPRKVNDLGQFRVQQPQASLKLAIYDFPLHKIDRATWGLLGEKPQSFADVSGSEWSASLAPILTKPGEYKIRLSMLTDEADPQEYTENLTVRFQLPPQKVQRNPAQPLPTLVLTSPAPGAVYYDEDGKGPPPVELQGELQLPKDAAKFTALVLVKNADNDKEEVQAAVTVEEEKLTAKVPLKYRDNRIQVLLSNNGNDRVVAGELQLRYLRPPQIVQVEAPKESSKPRADLVATIRSPLELTPQSVEADVNGREIARNQITVDKQPNNTWKIQIKDISLSPDTNRVNFWVSNAEAKSRQPGTGVILFKPARQTAEVEYLNPPVNTKVTDPTFDIRFRVKSATPLQQVQLVREGREPIRKMFPLAGLQPNAQGFYVFEEKNLPLLSKDNVFRVDAVNEGGTQHASVVINYVQVPVRLTIDRLFIPNKRLEPITPVEKADGVLYVPPVPAGNVRLEGHVTWGKENDEQLRKAELVKVFVNGFQQVPGLLDKPNGKARERKFTAHILLNRAEGNFVELQLPNIKQEASNYTEFTVACQEPVTGQHLHLLIVGVDEKDEERLKAQAFTALQATQAGGITKTPAFEVVRTYGPLTGTAVSPGQVFYQLCLIKKTIDLHARQGSPNDVVMVYYQGKETVNEQGHFFQTSLCKYNPRLQESAITCDGLSGYFADTLGAQILLLDVMRTNGPSLTPGEATDRIAKWPDSSYTGVMRYLKRLQAGQPAKEVLLTDLSDVMPKAVEWGDVLAGVKTKVDGENKVAKQKLVTLDESFRTPLKRLVVGKKI
jgi:WD40 repeat protein